MKLKKNKENTVVSVRPKKQRVYNVGLHRVRVGILWLLFIGAFAFAIYKNFTAIDRIETVTVERIEEKVVSTQAVEEYVKDFAAVYFGWTADTVSERQENLTGYLGDDLLRYAVNMLQVNVTNSSEVYKNEIWNVEKTDVHSYRVRFLIGQRITNKSGTKLLSSGYETEVYVDDAGDMVISKLPVKTTLPKKSDYQKAAPVAVEAVDADVQAEILEFIQDFFGIYPSAARQDLKYYADADVVPVINDGSYRLSAVDAAVITAYATDTAQVDVTVTYASTATEANETYQYTLTLKKLETWKITAMQ